jgi:hypothetical protein
VGLLARQRSNGGRDSSYRKKVGTSSGRVLTL